MGSLLFTGRLSGFTAIEARKTFKDTVLSSDCGIIWLLLLAPNESLFFCLDIDGSCILLPHGMRNSSYCLLKIIC